MRPLLTFLRRLFGGRGDRGQGPRSLPWERRPSILEFVRSHLTLGKPGLDDDDWTLPDEDTISQGSKIRWAAGAMDGVATHHVGTHEDQITVRKTVQLLRNYSREPTEASQAAIYEHVLAGRVVSVIDPIIEAVRADPDINHERLYHLARFFVTEAPDREPLKFGIALLGLFRETAHEEIFQTLGRHDEFTLFCAVALASSSESPDEALWTLARNVTGWGRIHVVERLAQTTNSAIKDWLLREGFRNSIMYEYLAATCARAGGLLAALRGGRVDRDLLTAAGELIQALISGGPADGIDEYEDALPVIESFLGHMTSSAETVQDFVHVNAIKAYFDEDDSGWARRYEAGWTPEGRDRLRLVCESILARPEWPDRVRRRLRSGNEGEFAEADQAAGALGIDTWDLHRDRLNEKPTDAGRWYHVMARCDEARIGNVIEFAETTLDLASVATEARDELGMGPGFESHHCLGFVLQELRRFPGRGQRLVQAGLRSPVIRNRNMAVAALAAWPRETWPAGLEQALEEAIRCERDEEVRERMRGAWRSQSQ